MQTHRGRLSLMIFSALAAALAFAAPARAEVLNLDCTDPPYAPTLVTVDLSNQTGCIAINVAPGCKAVPAAISDQYIDLKVHDGHVTINRLTGVVVWASGKTGMCTAAKQRF